MRGVDLNRPLAQAQGLTSGNRGVAMAGKRVLRRIAVIPSAGDRSRGTLRFAGHLAPCALGRAGVARAKHEGDGATPFGHFRFVRVYYRPDRVGRPATLLPIAPLRPDLGWCDDPADRNYNRPVRLPFTARHERLWRKDRLYDLLVVLDYNLARPVPGAGSAIFLHLATPGFAPTAGCVAVAPAMMRQILERSGPDTMLWIGQPPRETKA